VSTPGAAEIFDLGYQPYEGERTGRWARRRAIWRDGVRVSLGLGRGTTAKVAPWLLISFALVPMVVLVVLAAFLGSVPTSPDDFELPSYADYFDFAIVPLALFAAVVAPLLLCSDRRDGVLALYGARPIAPRDYTGSRWAAFFTVAAAVTCLPEAILFVWNALDARQTGPWLKDNWDIVPRFLIAGATVAAALTTLSLLAASFTARRTYATIAALAVLFIGSAIGGIAEDNFTGRVAETVSLVALPQVLTDAVHWIFGDPVANPPVSGGVSTLWVAVLTVVLAGWLLRRTNSLVRG
jgi:ABC-2 type transport system permease protein